MKTYLELKNRELSSRFSFKSRCVGFLAMDVLQMSRLDANVFHNGCVNTAKWYLSGEYLVTGSDDRTVKIWSLNSSALDNVRLSQTVATKHRGNIFCAEISPLQSNTLITAAADGVLYANHIDQSYPPSILHDSDELIHMFLFDVDNGNIIYTAEESGHLHRIDLRVAASSPSRKELLFNYSGRSIKALTQSPYFGGTQLFVGGSGFHVGMFDLRVLRTANNPSGTHSFARSWRPVNASTVAAAEMSVSVSGLQISKDGRNILTSYQGDQIFIYDVLDSVENSESAAPYRSLGGHINYATFLKTVSFYGPRDEYVVSGSDSGHLWIWDSATGHAVNVLAADERTCNGAVPHPLYPLLASYGIDSDVKLWCQQHPSQLDSEFEKAPDESRGFSIGDVSDGEMESTGVSSRAVGCPALKRPAECLELKPFEESRTSSPKDSVTELSAESLQKLCKFGCFGDKFRYERLSVPILQAGRRLLTNPVHLPNRKIASLFSLSERNKRLARSGALDIRFFREEITPQASRVFMLSNFNEVVKKCRSMDQYSFMLRSHQSGQDYSSFDSGNFMPSDYMDAVVNATTSSFLPEDLTALLREHLSLPDANDSNSLQGHVSRVINTFTNHQEKRIGQNSNMLGCCNSKENFPTRHKFLEFSLVPLYALFQVVIRSKVAGNNAFKAGDLAIAYYFYLKACRYCRFILLFKQTEWLSRRFSSESGGNASFNALSRGMQNPNEYDLDSDIHEDEYLPSINDAEEPPPDEEEDEDEGFSVEEEDAEDEKEEEEDATAATDGRMQQVLKSDGAESQAKDGDVDPSPTFDTCVSSAEKLDRFFSDQFVRKVVPELLKTVLTNMAVALSKMNAFSDALNACSEAFSVVKKYGLPSDAKLLFRRGSALLSLKAFDAAVKDLDAASSLAPQDIAITMKLKEARRNLEAQKKREMRKYSKMFD